MLFETSQNSIIQEKHKKTIHVHLNRYCYFKVKKPTQIQNCYLSIISPFLELYFGFID